MRTDLPTTLDEALDVYASHPEATLLAGGTDLMVEINFSQLRPSHVIALRRIEELTGWEDDRLGAGVTYRRLEQGPIRALAELSRTVGSPQIRNAGTIGGNLGTCSPAGDVLPFLSALDAEVELASAMGGRRRVPFSEFMVGPKQNSASSGEVIVAALLPADIPERQAFGKIGVRNAMVISIASACVFRADDGTTRVALGSVGPTMIRPTEAERMISAESRPSASALEEFARLVSEAVQPITDQRSTSEYRRHASGVLARRLLERCLQ